MTMMDVDRTAFMAAQDDRRSGRRHATVLLIGRVGHGAHEAACLVHDISPSGLMARFTLAPAVGDRLRFEVRGLPEFTATVRWVNGYKAGVEFDEAQDLERVFCLRDADGLVARTPRFAIEAGVTLTLGSGRIAADMLDISPGGAKLRTTVPVRLGQAGKLALPEIEGAAFGSICWVREDRFGFRFAAPLPLATLSRVLGCCP